LKDVVTIPKSQTPEKTSSKGELAVTFLGHRYLRKIYIKSQNNAFMRSSEKITASIIITFLIVLFSVPSVQSQYEGNVFTGSKIRVGVNDFGALGVDDEELGSVGFQYPIGSEYESLATGWWGDGWSVFYGENSAGFSPDDWPWGTIEDVTPTVSVRTLSDGYLKTIVLNTNDGQLQLTFKIRFFTDKKFLIVVMFIKNVGAATVQDLEAKRIVDWDIWYPEIEDYDNYFGMDNIRKPNMNLAVAFINSSVSGGYGDMDIASIDTLRPVYMGFASREKPTDYDLDWDDYESRDIYDPYKVSLSYEGATSAYFDGCVVYQWLLGRLKPGETKALHMVYTAGDSLEELEKNVAQAFKIAVTIR